MQLQRPMEDKHAMQPNLSRRAFVSTAAGAAALAGSQGSVAQLVYTTKDWSRLEFDKVAGDPARVKQVFDIVRAGDGKFLNSIKNSLNGLHFGFGIPVSQIKVAAALHGPANMLNFDDFIWSKYKIGAWLTIDDPATGQPATRNPFYARRAHADSQDLSQDPDDPASIYQDTSMETLQRRGVTFLSCHTALEEQARALIEHYRLSESPESMVRSILEHALPGVLVVASMSAAIALLQTRGHYSYITVD
jgi:hypothetical protein